MTATQAEQTGQAEQAERAAALAARTQHEASIKRNPHGDFKAVEAARPDWAEQTAWHYTKTRAPDWQWGQGGNDGGASLAKEHVAIDPQAPGRAPTDNYKLMISAIVPRPVGFLSTLAADGRSSNLSPFSYTNMFCHDPPIFAVGIAGSIARAKDSLANIVATKECVLNIISEHFIEAANATSVNAPYGVSEWALSGLHQAPTSFVKPPRVKEAVFSAECKLVDVKEFESKAHPGKRSGALVILEGVNFWVREDAINEERNIIDPAVLRPICRLGGITYGRVTEGFEIPRPDFSAMKNAPNADELLEKASKP
ncbi:FMN-binding split barrel [Niveomyces insectorum RCEF 264]|uniref:FMN-binding split barrel n=1 Tax=Niveomyces insectorum RCEF 264 TaxID=1081102 RepID=A0A167TXB0_9HYPO|nr:FMN-binding split barrel [Niveomyces insectorum RCEF 264]